MTLGQEGHLLRASVYSPRKWEAGFSPAELRRQLRAAESVMNGGGIWKGKGPSKGKGLTLGGLLSYPQNRSTLLPPAFVSCRPGESWASIPGCRTSPTPHPEAPTQRVTIELLNALDVVMGQAEVLGVRVNGRHQGSRVLGVLQPHRVAKLVGCHQEQAVP